MNDDAETWLIDHNPSKLLPRSQLISPGALSDAIIPEFDEPSDIPYDDRY